MGTNSIRLTVAEAFRDGGYRILDDEKETTRLGRGLQATARLNEDGMAQAFTVMHRYHAVARAMGASPPRHMQMPEPPRRVPRTGSMP